ncbi:hypothetical protein ACP4OV_016362 [Aristida adscensionis]
MPENKEVLITGAEALKATALKFDPGLQAAQQVQ